jgi:hypothetical protein
MKLLIMQSIMQILNVKRRNSICDILIQILTEVNGRGLNEILILYIRFSFRQTQQRTN